MLIILHKYVVFLLILISKSSILKKVKVTMSGNSLLSLYMFIIFLSQNLKTGFGLSTRSEVDVNIKCIERERQALLKIKQDLIDEYGHLSSWGDEGHKKDCCNWRRVSCSNRTGHVISLNLATTPNRELVNPLPLKGEIPESLSQLDSLGVLNLSNNNLSGKIPSSTKPQSFSASSYMGNPDLCGSPLLNKCSEDKVSQDPIITVSDNEDGLITQGFYISMVFGFIIGFYGVCGTLVLNQSWRYAYFRFLNNTKDKLYIFVALNVAKLQRKLRS